MSVIYLKERQDPFECHCIPAHVTEPAPKASIGDRGADERLPGAGRRNWVYREIAMLGADTTPGSDAIAWLEDVSPQ